MEYGEGGVGTGVAVGAGVGVGAVPVKDAAVPLLRAGIVPVSTGAGAGGAEDGGGAEAGLGELTGPAVGVAFGVALGACSPMGGSGVGETVVSAESGEGDATGTTWVMA